MLSTRRLLASLSISLTFPLGAWAQYQYQSQFQFSAQAPVSYHSQSQNQELQYQDAYPDRKGILENSFTICRQLHPQDRISSAEVAQLIERYFLAKPIILKTDYDSTGWTIDLSFQNKPGGFLRLMKNKEAFSLSYRQSPSKIEGIADIALDSNCQSLSNAQFTYHNSSMRPFRKVKLNSLRQVVNSVVMEEPVKNLPLGVLFRSNRVRIGTIDSGLDYNHPAVMEKSRPMLGMDLTDPQRPPYDYTTTVLSSMGGKHFSHGTAVADIASRNVDALIVPARVDNESLLTGAAVEHLAKNGVRLVNISQGTQKLEDWLPLKEAIQKHPEMLFIVSAGNDAHDISKEPHYPASFALPNMLVVAAIDREGKLTGISNYSSQYVHVAALGDKVEAALAGGGTWVVSGTSFAAPLVTNIAAKLLSENPKLTTQELRAALIQKAKPSAELKGKVQYGVLELE